MKSILLWITEAPALGASRLWGLPADIALRQSLELIAFDWGASKRELELVRPPWRRSDDALDPLEIGVAAGLAAEALVVEAPVAGTGVWFPAFTAVMVIHGRVLLGTVLLHYDSIPLYPTLMFVRSLLRLISCAAFMLCW